MTFQEKYSELYSNYEKAGKELEYATQKLSETKGFGDSYDIDNYFLAHKNLRYQEKQFQELLTYVKEGIVNPETKFVDYKFMYDFIKIDQIKKGNWSEDNLNNFFTCEVGLTNDPEIKQDYQRSFYKFPVLNLNHGKECYSYLIDRLEFPKDDNSTIHFSKINEANPIFVKISMRAK